MPEVSNTARKIDRLAEIAINEYRIDAELVRRLVERAKSINEQAKLAGFTNTDVFMGEDGVFAISAYCNNRSLGIAILDNGYDYYAERNRKRIGFATNLTEEQVFKILNIWGEVWVKLWRSSESYQDIRMTPTEEVSTPLLSGTIAQVDFRS